MPMQSVVYIRLLPRNFGWRVYDELSPTDRGLESIPTLTHITSVLSMHLGLEPGTWCTRKGDKTTPNALYNGKYTLRNTKMSAHYMYPDNLKGRTKRNR